MPDHMDPTTPIPHGVELLCNHEEVTARIDHLRRSGEGVDADMRPTEELRRLVEHQAFLDLPAGMMTQPAHLSTEKTLNTTTRQGRNMQQIDYQLTVEYDDDYNGAIPTETDIEDAIRKGLPDEVGADVESINVERQ